MFIIKRLLAEIRLRKSMQNIFPVVLFIYYYVFLLAAPHVLWDLSSPTREPRPQQ